MRLFNVMDGHWRQDMEQVERMLKELNVEAEIERLADEEVVPDADHALVTTMDPSLCKCCCASNCSLSLHVSRGVKLPKQDDFEAPEIDTGLDVQQDVCSIL